MADLYRYLAWPVLARLDPEDAHTFALRALAAVQRAPGGLYLLEALFAVRDPRLEVEVFGRRFPNPVGLAAGLDKDARAPAAFAALGFGAVEVGTVTPVGQRGNPRPRIFRLPEQRALINRMGFPNQGAARIRARLLNAPRTLPGGAVLGVNLGKGAHTPLDDAARDYIAVLDALHPFAGYAVVNVSSPNTQGLRGLQERGALEALLRAVIRRRDELAYRSSSAGEAPGLTPSAATGQGRTMNDEWGTSAFRPSSPRRAQGRRFVLRPNDRRTGYLAHAPGGRVPLLVKLAPDLSTEQLAAVVEAVLAAHVDGIVATNTTVSRESVSGPRAQEPGGLSGEPLRQRSTEVIRLLARETGGRLPIVGVGGISHPDHALEKLDAGASLVQLYTGLVYEGPSLPGRICRALLARRATA